MKKTLLIIIIGIIIGMVIAGILIWKHLPGMMFRVVESKYDFDETVMMIQEESFKNDWEVLHVYDIGGCLFENGFRDTYMRINVISICQSEYSLNILQDDENKKISAIMPCRIAVYEDKEGDVYLTRMNIRLFSKVFPGIMGDILKMVADDDEKIIEHIIEKD